MFRPLTFLAFGLIAAMAAGCGAVTPGGLAAAARLDPLTTPPADLSVAIGVPHQLQLRDGDAELFLGYQPQDTTPPVSVTVPLTVRTGQTGPAPQDGVQVYVLGMSPEDAGRVAATQAGIRALKDRDVPGLGTLSISVTGGCLTAPLAATLPVTTWIQPGPDAAFVPLTGRVDLLAVLPEADSQALRARLAPC